MTVSSCFCVTNTQVTLFQRITPTSEEVLDGLCHFLSVDISNTAWAPTGLINELSENTFGTISRIRTWKSTTQLDTEFGPKNLRRSHKQNSTLKTNYQAMVVQFVPYKHIKHIVVSWWTIVLYLVLWPV